MKRRIQQCLEEKETWDAVLVVPSDAQHVVKALERGEISFQDEEKEAEAHAEEEVGFVLRCRPTVDYLVSLQK
jgi:hypothetical protein